MTHLEAGVALVTGAGRGIGRAVALRLAADGAHVAVNDIDLEPAMAVVEEIRASGGRASCHVASVTDRPAVHEMVRQIHESCDSVRVLVSNAGVAASGRSVLDTTLEEAEQLMAVNTFAAMALCQTILPEMRVAGGDIIVVSSTATDHVLPHSGPYTMAKAALEALAFTLAKEEARHRVRVNIVAPTMTDTRLGREIRDRMLRGLAEDGIPLHAPEDVADVVATLLRDPDPAATGRRIALEPVQSP